MQVAGNVRLRPLDDRVELRPDVAELTPELPTHGSIFLGVREEDRKLDATRSATAALRMGDFPGEVIERRAQVVNDVSDHWPPDIVGRELVDLQRDDAVLVAGLRIGDLVSYEAVVVLAEERVNRGPEICKVHVSSPQFGVDASQSVAHGPRYSRFRRVHEGIEICS